MSSPKIRTFIAIEIPDAIRQKIADLQSKLKKHEERISWSKPGNIHLTLKFLGDVEEEKIASIGNVLQDLQKFQPFRFFVKNIGAFPNLKRPRVFWVDIEDKSNGLRQIVETIEDNLNRIGFPKEKRRFNPHLTVGRAKSDLSDAFIEGFKTSEFIGGEVRVEEIVLIKSQLHPKGSIYTPIKKIRLK